MNKQLFIKEIELAAKKLGLTLSLGDDGRIQIQKDGAELCRVNDEGAVFFRDSDLERCGGKSILSAFSNSVNDICEYLTAMEVVPFLKARGIDEWKQLCEFNRVVLACHPSRVGIQFVTWERDYDGSGVNNGHYFSDYQNAKRDFAVRAGLIPRNEILTKEELETMRSITRYALEHSDDMNYSQALHCEKLYERLDELVPKPPVETQENTMSVQSM